MTGAVASPPCPSCFVCSAHKREGRKAVADPTRRFVNLSPGPRLTFIEFRWRCFNFVIHRLSLWADGGLVVCIGPVGPFFQ